MLHLDYRDARPIYAQILDGFREQIRMLGFSYDWDREVNTTDPKYYKWTQWIFLKMFENGLVFRDTALVNYCPSCKVVLSNEDSQGGKCDICKSDIIQKSKDVWYLRITEYADKLLGKISRWVDTLVGAILATSDTQVVVQDGKLAAYHIPLVGSHRTWEDVS